VNNKHNAQPAELNHYLYKYGKVNNEYTLFNDLDEYTYCSNNIKLSDLISNNSEFDTFYFLNNWCDTVDGNIPCKNGNKCEFPKIIKRSEEIHSFNGRSKGLYKLDNISKISYIHSLSDDDYINKSKQLITNDNVILHFIKWSGYLYYKKDDSIKNPYIFNL
jgi:hypothetical protein